MNLWSVLVQLCILAERLLGNFNNQGGEDSPVQQLEPQTISTPLTPPPAIVQAPLLLVSTLLELDIESQLNVFVIKYPNDLLSVLLQASPIPGVMLYHQLHCQPPFLGYMGHPEKDELNQFCLNTFPGLTKLLKQIPIQLK